MEAAAESGDDPTQYDKSDQPMATTAGRIPQLYNCRRFASLAG